MWNSWAHGFLTWLMFFVMIHSMLSHCLCYWLNSCAKQIALVDQALREKTSPFLSIMWRHSLSLPVLQSKSSWMSLPKRGWIDRLQGWPQRRPTLYPHRSWRDGVSLVVLSLFFFFFWSRMGRVAVPLSSDIHHDPARLGLMDALNAEPDA